MMVAMATFHDNSVAAFAIDRAMKEGSVVNLHSWWKMSGITRQNVDD